MRKSEKILPLLALAIAIPSSSSADSWANVLKTGTAFRLEKAQRQRDVSVPGGPLQVTLPNNVAGMSATITTMLDNAGIDPRDMNQRARGGRMRVQYGCFQSIGGFRNLGGSNVKVKKWGVAFAHKVINDLGTCKFLQIDVGFSGNRVLPEDTDFVVDSTLRIRAANAPGATADCSDKDVLCFHQDRFKAEINWRDFNGKTGTGVAVAESEEAGVFYFFDSDNWEMLVKVLDGCDSDAPFDSWWVFFAATTNVEYTLTVTDTQTNQARVYGNPLGVQSPAITDTSAFATCP